MSTYYDQDKRGCPEDYLQVTKWKSHILVQVQEEMVGDFKVASVDLDFDQVVKLQQELGQWLLEYKEP